MPIRIQQLRIVTHHLNFPVSGFRFWVLGFEFWLAAIHEEWTVTYGAATGHALPLRLIRGEGQGVRAGLVNRAGLTPSYDVSPLRGIGGPPQGASLHS